MGKIELKPGVYIIQKTMVVGVIGFCGKNEGVCIKMCKRGKGK